MTLPGLSLGFVWPDEYLQRAIDAAEKLGHRVRIAPGSTARSIELVADALAAEPVTCATCGRMIAQSWLDDCPACDGPLHEGGEDGEEDEP